MECLVRVLTDRLILRGIISENERPIYQYGLEVFLEMILAYLSILILALIFGNIFETVVFLFVFMLLRTYTGGFHASTRFRCYVLSLCMYGCFSIILFVFPENWISDVAMGNALITFVTVSVLSPIVHENRHVEVQERRYYRKVSIIMCMLFVVLIVAGKNVLGNSEILLSSSLGMLSISLSMIVAKIAELSQMERS